MPTDPVPRDLVTRCCIIKTSPQVNVFYRGIAGCFPVAFFPVRKPFCNSEHKILGIRGNLDFTRFFKCLQRHDCCCHLHAVVGRHCSPAGQGLRVTFPAHDCRPASRARVALARAIGKNFHNISQSSVLTSRLEKPNAQPRTFIVQRSP